MLADKLRKAVLQAAIQGKLTEQLETDGNAADLVAEIKKEKERLIKEKKLKKQKPLPEITAEEIPFEIPDNWCWVRLGDVGKIVGGGTPKTDVLEYWINGNIPWITPADMKNIKGKYIYHGEKYITSLGLNKSSAQLMPKNSILFSSRAPIGYIAITKKEVSTNQGFKSIVPFDVSLTNYIYYALLALVDSIKKIGTGTTFKEVSGSVVEKIIIPLPPLGEQKRIVKKIEEVLNQIEILKVNEEKLALLQKNFPDKLKKSLLQAAIQGKLTQQLPTDDNVEDLLAEIRKEKEKLIKEKKIKKQKPLPPITAEEIPFEIPVNWRWVRLGDVSHNVQYGVTASAKKTGDARLVRISDIQENNIVWDLVPYCNIVDKLKEVYVLKENDILFARTGGTVGKSVVVKNVLPNAVFASYLIRLNYNRLLNYRYIKYFMESDLYWKQLNDGTTVTAQPNCNGNTLSKMIIPLPPLNEQKRIVEQLDRLLANVEDLKVE